VEGGSTAQGKTLLLARATQEVLDGSKASSLGFAAVANLCPLRGGC